MTSYSGRTTDSRSRNWCFTLNNYTDEDIDKLVNSSYKYLIIGKEVAPTTNTPHLQGFIIFPNARRLSTLKADYNKTTHWEIARGTPEQNIEYCSKSGNFQEHGTKPDTLGRLKGWLSKFYYIAECCDCPGYLQEVEEFILDVGNDLWEFTDDYAGIHIDEISATSDDEMSDDEPPSQIIRL